MPKTDRNSHEEIILKDLINKKFKNHAEKGVKLHESGLNIVLREIGLGSLLNSSGINKIFNEIDTDNSNTVEQEELFI